MGFSGGCSCGAVRYTIDAEPVRAFQCQCRDCQMDSGGGHSSVFVFPRAALGRTESASRFPQFDDPIAQRLMPDSTTRNAIHVDD